jgi:hypothetical protein
VLCVPLVAFAPLQPPEAVHEVAFVELHVSVEAPPLVTVVGFAVSVTVAAGTIVLLLPPPLHEATSSDAPMDSRRTSNR